MTIEEIEAIRLKDIEDLEQEQSAEKMNVSRSTFVRILDASRKKIADALINGKAIRIVGGNFEMAVNRFRCRNEHEWDIPPENMSNTNPQLCPVCKTSEIETVQIQSQDEPPEQEWWKTESCRKRSRKGHSPHRKQ
jgi:hypothetical protein